MRVHAIRSPWVAALLASLLTATLLGGIQIALAQDDLPEPNATAREVPQARATITTTRVGANYQRVKTVNCPAGPNCASSGIQVNCDAGDWATGGSTVQVNLADQSKTPFASYWVGTRGWRNDTPFLLNNSNFRVMVKCVDLTP